MVAASTYEDIILQEREIENKEIVVFLFVRPTNSTSLEIVREFEYIHYNSKEYCSIYAIGYTDDFGKKKDRTYKKVETVCQTEWFFSHKAFVDFKDKLEDRIKWKYSGEAEIIILQNNPGHRNPLNFQNYVAIDINKGIRDGYIDSFQAFMESLVRGAREKVTAKGVVKDIAKQRVSIKDIIVGAVNDCKRIPTPVKDIISDRLFYRCANSIAESSGCINYHGK